MNTMESAPFNFYLYVNEAEQMIYFVDIFCPDIHGGKTRGEQKAPLQSEKYGVPVHQSWFHHVEGLRDFIEGYTIAKHPFTVADISSAIDKMYCPEKTKLINENGQEFELS